MLFWHSAARGGFYAKMWISGPNDLTRQLERSFAELEREKSAALSGLSALSATQLNFQPDPGSWSILGVIDHLVKVESALIAAVRSNFPGRPAPTLKENAGAFMVTAVMRSPVRVKVPATAKAVLPGPALDLISLTEQWDRTRAEMSGLFHSLSPDQLHCALFQHPVSGWMTLLQGAKFQSAHIRHHRYQIDRLKRAR